MKLTKRMAGISLAAIMLLTAAVPAVSAATDITEKVTKTHTYEIYQIFSGTQTEEGNQYLADIQWGDGVITDTLLADLKDTYNQEFKDANEVAKYVSTFTEDSNEAREFAILVNKNLSTTKTTLKATTDDYKLSKAGYYLIVDTTDVDGKEDDAKNLILLRFSNTTDATATTETIVTVNGIKNKTDVPELEKKVMEESYSSNDTADTGFQLGTGYNDVADYDIGDAVPFELIGTLPTNYSSYTKFNYVFHDEACDGLDAPENVTVTLYDKDSKKVEDITKYFAVNDAPTDGCTFEVACKDLTAIEAVTADSYIVVNYTAKLNEDAVIGLPGNENEAKLEYSNNPNVVYEVVKDTEGKPVFEDDGVTPKKKPVPVPGEEDTTGFTPNDKVIVFTYQLDLIKVDSDDNTVKLEGVTFALKNSAGKYYSYNATTKTVSWVDKVKDATTKTTDADGKISYVGIDANPNAVYYLEETEAKKGYSKLTQDIKVTLTATTANGQTWTDWKDIKVSQMDAAKKALTAASIKVEDPNKMFVDASSKVATDLGTFEFTEANEKGVKLPGTGGMGTTTFYITGSILVVAAGVLLIAKKRANSSK